MRPDSPSPSGEPDLPELLDRARRTVSTTPESAIGLADACIARAVAAADPRAEAAAWRIRGQALRALGRHSDAVDAFTEAARAARAAEDRLLAAQVQLGKIDSLAMVGRPDAAAALGEELAQEMQALGALTDAAKALCNLGSTHLRMDRYAAALDCYERADAVFAEAGDPIMQAVAQVNRALVLTYLGQVEPAILLYETARAAHVQNGLDVEAASVEHNVGYLHQVSGRYATAIASLNRAYTTFIERGRPLEAARCDVERGDAYRALNLFPEAMECYGRALSVFEGELPLDYDRAQTEMGRAAILLTQGRTTDGMAALERAETIFRRQRSIPRRAHVRLTRASALRASGSPEEALSLARAAARGFSSHRLHGWTAEARFLIAAITLEGNASEEAAASAASSLLRVCRTARQEGRGWLECRAEHALGQYHARAGRTTRALDHLRRGVAALESARTRIAPEEMHTAFLRDKQAVYEDLVALLLTRGRPDDFAEALSYVERSRSRLLLDRIAAAAARIGERGEDAAALPETLGARLEALRAELSRAYRQSGALESGDDPRRLSGLSVRPLAELERAYAEALREAELEAGPSVSVLAQDAVPLADLQRALASEEALISFYAAHGALTAFIIERDGLHVVRDIAQMNDVEQASRRLRYHIQKMQMQATTPTVLQQFQGIMEREIRGVLTRLYDLLLRPLEPLLGEDAARRLIILPYGGLHGLPFHAFYTGTGYALDRWEVTYAPSAAIWHRVRTGSERPPSDSSGEALLVGLPSTGLERVRAEIEQLGALLPKARTLLQEEATLSAVTQAIQGASVLHLATHAHFRQDNPHFSGLLLADGWLMAHDLYRLPTLTCDLVTLSACETVVSRVEPGDELFGLVRGFLAAGARSVVGTLWPVEDSATAELMTAFYAARQQGFANGAALRQAQRSLRESHSHPYHWASFILIGQSDPAQKL